MAEFVPSTPRAEWNALATEWRDLKNGIANDGHAPAKIRLAAVEDRLLDGHAPDLEGVILKLTVLWQDLIDFHGPVNERHLGVIGDLRRIQFEAC